MWSLLILLQCLPAVVLAQADGPRILVVHSYSQEYPWTRSQHEGFTDYLYSRTGSRPLISAEYLDTKRKAFTPEYAEQFGQYLAAKYEGYRPSLIYVTDDNALVFAVDHLEQLFPDVPVFFSGVNDYEISNRLDPARYTGVFERKDIAANIRLLRSMDRSVDRILVVGDGSNTYRSIERETREALRGFPDIAAEFVATDQIEQLERQLAGRAGQYLFLTTLGGMSDLSGNTLGLDEAIQRIAGAGDFIVLSMEDAYLVDGVLGGFVTSGRYQGHSAGALVRAHLLGAPVAAIKAIKQSPNEYLFDHRELVRHGLTIPADIRGGATVLNEPMSFYDRHRALVQGLFVLLIALVFFLMAALVLIANLRSRQIRSKSHQLTAQAELLERVRDNLANAQRIARLGSWDWDLLSGTMNWSDEEFRLFGEEPQSFSPNLERYLSYVVPEGRHEVRTAIDDAVKRGSSFELELKVVRGDGAVRYIRETGRVKPRESGDAVSIIGTTLDVTAAKLHEQKEKRRFERIERYQDALLEWSRVDYKNLGEALGRATEISAQTLNAGRVSIWLFDDSHQEIHCQSLFSLLDGVLDPGLVLKKTDFPMYFEALESGKPMVIADARTDYRTSAFTESYLVPLGIVSMLDAPIFYRGAVVGVVCHEEVGEMREWTPHEQEFASAISRSVSLSLEINKRLQIEQQLEHQAYHDSLTGLPNRSLLMDRLDQAIKQAKRTDSQLAVLFLDLDKFKEINDSLGHQAGDQVLVAVAEKLKAAVREADTVARLGGDEFTVIISSFSDVQSIHRVAMKLVNVIQESMVIGPNQLYITSSMGVSIYPDDGETAEALLRNSDAAMYRAKDEGRNSFQFYTQDMTELAFERVLMESNLRRALESEEFVVHYQPQFSLATGALVGMEALVRWQHTEMGMVPPVQFIPAAEESGLIVPIDRWVMRTALKQIGEWYRQGYTPGRLALNLAVKQLHQDDLVEMLGDVLKETGCQPDWLALEITESKIMTKPEHAIQVLQQVSELGVEIAMDDFGTGYSSLAYLKRLPVDKLKIDKSFVRDVPEDEGDVAIVRAVIALARSMGLSVTAEGVETEEQKAFLLTEGCQDMQGYLCGRPMAAEDMKRFLESETARLDQTS